MIKMKMRAGGSKLLVSALAMVFALWACKKEVPVIQTVNTSQQQEYNDVKSGILSIMQQYYLWNTQLPQVTVSSVSTPQEMLDTLMYKKYDRYSFLTSKSAIQALFKQGQYVGYGISFEGDSLNRLRVAFLFDQSPLLADGVKRGWILKSVNGTAITPSVDVNTLLGASQAGVSNNMVFTDSLGTDHAITAQKQTITLNTVLSTKMINYAGRKIGYLAFESFVATSVAELNNAFAQLRTDSINDLVVDLRYNGGGMADVALDLANLMVGDIASGRVFANFEYNAMNAGYDTAMYISPAGDAFGLQRVFYITSGNTASASEMMINGLKPFIPVYLVGSQTYGKPVGMLEFDFIHYDYSLFPICFSITNENHQGGYFDGIPVDSPQPDDLDHELGSPNEACLSAVLYYIKNGSFPAAKKSLRLKGGWGLDQKDGYRMQVGAY